jgi:hypothetical protein
MSQRPSSTSRPDPRRGNRAGEPARIDHASDRAWVFTDQCCRRCQRRRRILGQGLLSPDDASAAVVWPEPLLNGTDSDLAAFEGELRALASPSDEDILGAVRRVALALNKINERRRHAGSIGYETGSAKSCGSTSTRHCRNPGLTCGRWRPAAGDRRRLAPLVAARSRAAQAASSWPEATRGGSRSDRAGMPSS